jgi:hypothetical protein
LQVHPVHGEHLTPQGASARQATKALQGTSSLVREALLAGWPIAAVLEKSVPE